MTQNEPWIEDEDGVVEIDEEGRVKGQPPGRKPVILRDPEGEY